MKKINGKKMIEKIWQNAAKITLLIAIITITKIEATAQSSACDPAPYFGVTQISIDFTNNQVNVSFGLASFSFLRNGNKDHTIYLATDLPDDTVLKAYLNGVELASLTRGVTPQGVEYWQWDGSGYGTNPPLAQVGDLLEIKKDGASFLSGNYTREQYDYEQVGGYVQHGNPTPCSLIRGNVYLPTSSAPRLLDIYFGFTYAPIAITKISLNEINLQTGGHGTEIATLPISSTSVSGGWYRANINVHNQITLTENQFSQLRQGLLTVVTFTADQPQGYSEMPLQTQAINSSGDFEGDGMADLAVFRPSTSSWYLQNSSNNLFQAFNFGLPSDKLVIGDYDSDNKTDIAAYQVDNPNYQGLGVWKTIKSSDNTVKEIQWGLPTDIPLAMNIDNNNTSDLAVFRPSNGIWYVYRMGDIIKPRENANAQTYVIIPWGTAGDKPLAGDFNNDRIDELVVFRPSDGNWYIYNSVDNSYQVVRWGLSDDIPMLKDFDGDGRVDLTVYRPSNGTWYIRSSINNSLIARRFGLSDDIPVPADFDKDGVSDIAVFRPSNGTWYVTRSSDNSFFAARFGTNGDIPAFAQR